MMEKIFAKGMAYKGFCEKRLKIKQRHDKIEKRILTKFVHRCDLRCKPRIFTKNVRKAAADLL